MSNDKVWVLLDPREKRPEPQEILMPDVIAPTVNLNGSTAASMIDGYSHFLETIRNAEDALKHIAPHGRDFQTRPASVFDLAVRHHRRRAMVLRQLHEEIETMALDVQSQEHQRAEIRRQA